jgi:putative N-acetyltransferase (TIGR04045 family)
VPITGADVSTYAAVRTRESVLECRVATAAADLALHHAIRHAVFVTEQHVFPGDDRDGRDGAPGTLHVLGLVDGTPAGTVRLYPLDHSGGWQGDRLAVLPEYRSRRLGAPLVRFAVATAGALGGHRMIAHVQPDNGPFFRRLGWRQLGGPELYVGLPHLLMDIAISDIVLRGPA